jgi:hypothetical protein
VTGVRIACKQKPKLTCVLHHAEEYFFCLMLCLIARLSRLGFQFAVCFRLVVVCAVDLQPDPRSGPARGPTRPGPALARAPPSAPPPPMHPLLSLSFFFSRATTSLSLSSTSLTLGVIRWTVAADRRIPR